MATSRATHRLVTIGSATTASYMLRLSDRSAVERSGERAAPLARFAPVSDPRSRNNGEVMLGRIVGRALTLAFDDVFP